MEWIFLATSIIALFIIYFKFLETIGKIFEEIDECFQERVNTRAFKGHMPEDS